MNEQELVFQVYDLDAGTCEETFWRTVQYRPEDVDRLVQEWKDKGYRLVMDGYLFPTDSRYGHHPRFFTAKMYRMWAEGVGTTSTPPDSGTRQFIWVTGGGDINSLVSDEPPADE